MLWPQSVHGSAGYEAMRQVPQVVGCAAAAVGGAGGQRVSEEKCLTQSNEKFFFNDKPSGLHGNSVYVQLCWSRKKNLTNFKNVSSFMTIFF